MTITFRPAVRQDAPLLLGLAGPSGSGKTYSALRLAKGLANGKPIFMVDTESGRGTHYADQFDYQYAQLDPPFSPSAYMAAIQAAVEAGAGVCIVDSMSHGHEGPGGLLEMHEAELERMAGNDWKKRERVKFAAWIKPKKAHNAFVNAILQMPIHLIFCFRAKDKLELVLKDGKQTPVSAGWQPICSDRFEYEMTALLVLPPGSQGKPDLGAQASKIQAQHRPMIGQDTQISEDLGQRLAAWASGGGASNQGAKDVVPEDDGPTGAERFANDCRDRIRTATADTLPTIWREMQSDPNWRGLPDHLINELTSFKDARKAAVMGQAA